MPKTILHISTRQITISDGFFPSFIEFIKENFDNNEHVFLLKGDRDIAQKYAQTDNVAAFTCDSFFSKFNYYGRVILRMHLADKVILHGLFNIKLVIILFFAPWLLRKCYWVILGGDLYNYKLGEKNKRYYRHEFFRRPVITNMGHLVSYIEGDVKLAREWYGAKGKYHECVIYPSNLYKEYRVPAKQGSTINIQVGNSATASNNHIEAFEKLLPFREQDIAIYVPLSYGDIEYAQEVIKQGHDWFGDKFKPLTNFMQFEEYLAFLGSIDIAIFNHKRQQAMGNTITLLGLGKTVYLRNDTTQWQFFKDKGIIVGDVDQFGGLDCLNVENNQEKIKLYFSRNNYIDQLKRIFNDGSNGV